MGRNFAEISEIGSLATTAKKIVIRRLSSVEEVNANRQLIEDFFAETRFSQYELSWPRLENLVKAALQSPGTMAIFIAERQIGEKNQILGFAMCGISGFIAVVGLKLCQIQFLHILPEHRRTFAGGKAIIGLLRGVEKWAQSNGAREVIFEVEANGTNDGLVRIGKKAGWQASPTVQLRSCF